MKFATIMIMCFLFPTIVLGATIKVPKDYPAIQQAIDAASNGDTVLVAPGAYVENINFSGKAITLKSEAGPKATIINGNWGGSVVTFDQGEASTSILDGFTIYDGNGNGVAGIFMGGGVYCSNASPIIQNNIFLHNRGNYGGGMLCADFAAPLVLNNLFRRNSATWPGGDGAGIACHHSSPTIAYNTFIDNNATAFGGGIYCSGYVNPIIANNIFYENSAGSSGGGIYCEGYSTVSVINNTIYNNSATYGGGLGCSINSHITVGNSIIRKNQAADGDQIWVGIPIFFSTLIITDSNVEGGAAGVYKSPGCQLIWGPGMIDMDPLFVDPAENDFHLRWNSPCINSGNITLTPSNLLQDFEGDPRLVGSEVDMGADEFHPRLYHIGNLIPGGSIKMKFLDKPFTSPVVLWLGSGVLKNPMPIGNYGDWFLKLPTLFQVSFWTIPGNSVLEIPALIPLSLVPPIQLPFQGLIGSNLTNLHLLDIE